MPEVTAFAATFSGNALVPAFALDFATLALLGLGLLGLGVMRRRAN